MFLLSFFPLFCSAIFFIKRSFNTWKNINFEMNFFFKIYIWIIVNFFIKVFKKKYFELQKLKFESYKFRVFQKLISSFFLLIQQLLNLPSIKKSIIFSISTISSSNFIAKKKWVRKKISFKGKKLLWFFFSFVCA